MPWPDTGGFNPGITHPDVVTVAKNSRSNMPDLILPPDIIYNMTQSFYIVSVTGFHYFVPKSRSEDRNKGLRKSPILRCP